MDAGLGPTGHDLGSAHAPNSVFTGGYDFIIICYFIIYCLSRCNFVSVHGSFHLASLQLAYAVIIPRSPTALLLFSYSHTVSPFPLLFSSQLGTADAEIKVHSVENPQLSNVPPLKRGVGQ